MASFDAGGNVQALPLPSLYVLSLSLFISLFFIFFIFS
ncbi:hypothetical protein IC006_0752 [Sulfuracidifex tepidarius]|uniref:Uncharacterized protein n=1 Tax=Sulfuracidifex tepidarius TaxID=1294262 RepID=A0A510DTU2_9CREN|nr:hypothetical protein IC006_0752 [Sulfuracidifex tepidarius]BBG26220.1 hypothetical protein IC007_0725 [Sulfuracidifex tepidarius]